MVKTTKIAMLLLCKRQTPTKARGPSRTTTHIQRELINWRIVTQNSRLNNTTLES